MGMENGGGYMGGRGGPEGDPLLQLLLLLVPLPLLLLLALPLPLLLSVLLPLLVVPLPLLLPLLLLLLLPLLLLLLPLLTLLLHICPSSLLLACWPPCSLTIRSITIAGAGTAVVVVVAIMHTPALPSHWTPCLCVCALCSPSLLSMV
jgi:hypothetical protein